MESTSPDDLERRRDAAAKNIEDAAEIARKIAELRRDPNHDENLVSELRSRMLD